jgi:hypothetical protein
MESDGINTAPKFEWLERRREFCDSGGHGRKVAEQLKAVAGRSWLFGHHHPS